MWSRKRGLRNKQQDNELSAAVIGLKSWNYRILSSRSMVSNTRWHAYNLIFQLGQVKVQFLDDIEMTSVIDRIQNSNLLLRYHVLLLLIKLKTTQK